MRAAARRPSDSGELTRVVRPTAAVCGPFELLLDAAARLIDSERDALVVVASDDSRRPIGWLTPRDVACAAARDPGSLAALRVRSAMTARVHTCREDATPLEALERIREGRTGRLAVVDAAGRLRGVLSLAGLATLAAKQDAVRGALQAPICEALAARSRADARPSGADVRDAMTADPIACRVEDSLERVAGLFYEAAVPCLPVLQAGEGRRLSGIVSAREVCAALVSRDGRLQTTRVEAAMREKVASCWPDDSLEAAEAIMRAYRVRRLPVVDSDGQLVGILSLSDVARAVIRAHTRESVPRGKRREVVETLAALSDLAWGETSQFVAR